MMIVSSIRSIFIALLLLIYHQYACPFIIYQHRSRLKPPSSIHRQLAHDPYSIYATLSPSLQPLQYISPEVVVSYLFESAQYAVLSALLPTNQEEALAIFISEGLSGFLGGFAAKLVALVDGNKNNRDSSFVNGETSGAYFGTVGALRSLAQLAGLSSIFVNLISLLFAAFLSELIKIRNRALTSVRTRVGKGPSMYELMKFKKPAMRDLMRFAKTEKASMPPRMRMMMGSVTEIEIRSDVVKWFLISLLLSLKGNMTSLEDAVAIGVVSGVCAQIVREKADEEAASETRRFNSFMKKRLNQFILAERSQRTSVASSISEIRNRFFPRLGMRDGRQQLPSTTTSNTPSSLPRAAPSSPSDKKTPLRDFERYKVLDVDFAATRFARAAIEGATQLVTYEASRRYVMDVSPYFQNLDTLKDLAPPLSLGSLAAETTSLMQHSLLHLL